MPQPKYKTLAEAWDAYEEGSRDSAADDDEIVDENFILLQKVMFYQGATITLEILNRAGVLNEETMPAVAQLATEIRDIRIVFPEST